LCSGHRSFQGARRLADAALDEKSVFAAHGFAALVVIPNEFQQMMRKGLSPSAGADSAPSVLKADVALALAVGVHDARDSEPLLEGLPNVRAEAGARRDPECVLAVAIARRGPHQVAAEFPDVTEDRSAVAAHVVEELARAESSP